MDEQQKKVPASPPQPQREQSPQPQTNPQPQQRPQSQANPAQQTRPQQVPQRPQPQQARPAQPFQKPFSKPVSKDFRGIVRVLGKDIDGHAPLLTALNKIKGVGRVMAKNLCRAIKKELGISEKMPVGEIPDAVLTQIEGVVKSPEKHGIRQHHLNRPRDPETGESKHLLANDLIFAIRQGLTLERDTRSWKGWRKSLGQRVRGQHNRTTGRTGLTVGVLKKAIKAQKAAAATSAQEKGEKGGGGGGEKPAAAAAEKK